MEETVAVTFTNDELWLLQRCIRHEMPQQDVWKYPPASVELNDQIASGILLCAQYNVGDVTLQLSWGDLLAIDFTVPADAKDVNGRPIGRNVLLKSYAARAELRRAYPLPEVALTEEPRKIEIEQRLAAARWNEDDERYE
jgi:hypothetical protein